MNTINPAPNYLFCEPDKPKEEKTPSGILLTKQAIAPPKTANVINVGKEVTSYKPHDKIVYKSFSTTEIELNKQTYFMIHQDDVLGVVLEA